MATTLLQILFILCFKLMSAIVSAADQEEKDHQNIPLIIFGGVLPTVVIIISLVTLVVYCKYRIARRKHNRYSAYAKSIEKIKKTTELVDLGLAPGMTNTKDPPWITGQNLFKIHAQVTQPPNEKIGRSSGRPPSPLAYQSRRFNSPVTSICMTEDERNTCIQKQITKRAMLNQSALDLSNANNDTIVMLS